ncbi:LLM class flavin-dependent oxidoreductase [Candidatus Poribacteria bacterium]|nr:LLM class flavin-dependent oxidoreductase [Candidatus Poribacteria bacterium]MXV83021.1 LLM class flavin-dependent oxidoreductase [Candidatus Poribacteria bacterium]MYA56258.1 LLM class flavin-dependent oxidoreductase [Candidatus Poribacteria bacterium]
MKFGLFYEHQIPRPWHDGAEHKLFQDALAQVELADRLGFDYIWEVEHHFLEEYSHSSAPEVFLGACSQRTTQIRLGHGIVLMPPAYNHPARVAERIATLDLVSNGRVEWGTGESASRMELDGFNVDPKCKREMWAECTRETAKMMSQSPYPGYEGQYFSMPTRNVVPKPLQTPHPPPWVACSSRDSLRYAARYGLGALTFAFVDANEAKFWVEEYYEIFEKECEPLTQRVNPNIAMVSGFSCHEDEETAVARGLDGLRFFRFGLAHYYHNGSQIPGETDIWQLYKQTPQDPAEGRAGIGTPDQVREHLEIMEDAGVDQVVFIQQAGANRHEDIMESLELFAERVLPDFKARDAAHVAKKGERFAEATERAKERKPALTSLSEIPTVDSYPVLKRKLEEKTEETDANEISDDGKNFLLSIEGGKRISND